jgi:hypothetical protein
MTVPASGTREAVRTLNPGYFALVMASGMVSMAMYHQHAYRLSVALLWVTAVSYLVLVAVSAVRVISFPHEFRADLSDSGRAFGLFTFVSATNVLGARLVIDGHNGVAVGLLLVSSLAWLVLGYLIPWTAVLGTSERPVVRRANGTWFIWVVASQSIAVLAAVLEVDMPDPGGRAWRCSRWCPGRSGCSSTAPPAFSSLCGCFSTRCCLRTSFRSTGWGWAPVRSPCWPARGSSRWLMRRWSMPPAA